MTKLEEEILNNILERGVAMRRKNKDVTEIDRATFAAEVAKFYIEKAYVDSATLFSDPLELCKHLTQTVESMKDQWLKENGVV